MAERALEPGSRRERYSGRGAASQQGAEPHCRAMEDRALSLRGCRRRVSHGADDRERLARP